ncbi:MAG: RNA-binding transcriptional accessory protein [Pedobacter sp.]|nr:MAG: RNA-binding transcriptional accessory protein [Pedobacter sp.]
MQKIISTISSQLGIQNKLVQATLNLLEDGATVPFIARYRKEMTGSLDEVEIASIRDLAQKLKELEKRKEAILKSIGEQGKLTPALEESILKAANLTALEDIYLPYKPKRKTKAAAAREKGLEPLALRIFAQSQINPEKEAEAFIQAKHDLNTVEEVLAGARDIIAELIAEDGEVRQNLRSLNWRKNQVSSKLNPKKEAEGQKYKDYFAWTELAKDMPSHRILALFRGEEEEVLKLSFNLEVEDAMRVLERKYFIRNNAAGRQVELAMQDAYKRLLKPSMESELRGLLKEKADEEAIRVFVENLKQLLLAVPLGSKRVLAIDPGFRTGCKVVVLDAQGKLQQHVTIYPHQGLSGQQEASRKILDLIEKYQIEAIAIGNGTAGRETEGFIKSLKVNCLVVMVNESGASIYSASEVARKEFPDHDITIRGAVSIGRRLMDPLAELVKIDPKSIGVGQYQHDVDQKKLQSSLDDTVISCVNAVGVELNTASKEILSYVSGLGPSLAEQIVKYRDQHGAFKNRASLKKVPRLGEKAFEQAAGFLRIRNAQHVLDNTAVHPERYALVERMAKDLNADLQALIKTPALQQAIDIKKYVSQDIGIPTLQDILNELAKPGRDPREQFEAFSFAEGINAIGDLKSGMELKGIVTNITNFGAFVDIGVHQDGLVHTSQLAHRYVANPNDVVKVSQIVKVRVLDVDIPRKRISLTMKF